jgi:hypothetical protein
MSAVLLPLDGAEEAEVSFKLVAPEIDDRPPHSRSATCHS